MTQKGRATPKLSAKGGFAEIVIIVAVLVLAAIGGAYYLGTQKNKTGSTNSPSLVSQASPTTADARRPVPNGTGETVNWKTYKDTNNRFEFKYPDNVVTQEINSQDTDVLISFKYPGSPDGCELCDGYVLYFKLGNLNQQPLKQVAETELKKEKDNEFASNVQPLVPISTGNYSGFTFSYIYQIKSTNIYLSANKESYVKIIKSVDDPQSSGYEKTIDQILSTFKFTP